ncbi:hypothetical protein IU403_05950 [Aerococcaceae bacterium zg-BR22]|uniref:hypothetical protein n=1 Tax=Aerococcaceae bacterium zg-1292 TaxID=2774330 RepID=UPI00406329C2|nr:hypothetical protein [Aerococcaceae bacterium zg-BR22]
MKAEERKNVFETTPIITGVTIKRDSKKAKYCNSIIETPDLIVLHCNGNIYTAKKGSARHAKNSP